MNTLQHPKLPKYIRLGQELREQMAAGALKPGEKLPTVVELRAQFGVSVTTLDKVLTALEQDGLIVRSQGSGIYVAQPQPPEATGIIGVVGPAFVHSPDVPYWANLLSGLRAAAQGQQREILLLGDSAPGLGWEKIDGVLLCGGDESRLHRLPPGMPAVSLMYPSRRLPGVVADDRAATRALTEHLLRLGHRRIAFLTMGYASAPGLSQGSTSTSGTRHDLGYGAENELSRLRGEGYQAALWQAGIEPNPLWVRELMAPGSAPRPFDELGHGEMSRWLREDWQSLGCTALLAQNDEAAIGAIHALREAGLSVPEDVSVAGFDGTRIGEYCTPRLTSVQVPLQEIARLGIELLLRQITEQEASTETLVLPTSLIVRASTAPPRALRPQNARASRKRKEV